MKKKKKKDFICGKYKKFKNPKVSCIFEKSIIFFIICNNCSSKDKTYLKRKNQLRY